ncbi:MAG: hypothetical protein R2939_21080 [Kofleriaceae bacterium]
MIVSHATFILMAAIATAGVAGWWVVMDVLRLRRTLRERPRTRWTGDRIFGSVIGIATGVIGVAGIVLHYLR